MTRQYYPELAEEIFWGSLSNGLTIAVVPRRGFTKKLAYFVTDLGSIHTHFRLEGRDLEAPGGVAHFLEHKLFEMPGRGDVSQEFSQLGANPNAFTSYDMTAYYFSCTEHFEKNLDLLLEFVSTPYFTPETVEKEQGIIGQEIDMNLDSPDTQVFENLVSAMYRSHPITVPILGTRSTIAAITPEILEDVHRAFYNPGNMILCVVGDVDPEGVRRIAENRLGPLPGFKPEALREWPEAMTCPQSLVTAHMDVSMPMFQLGFKAEPTGRGPEAIRQELVADLAAEALFGESSRLYLALYEEGLIDASFGGGFETVEGMAMLTVSGDSIAPEQVRDAILKEARRLVAEGICPEDFLRMKRSVLGRRIRGLDSFESTCFRVCAYHLSGYDYFRFPELYRQIEAPELLAFIDRVVTDSRCCLSVILPEQEGE